MMPSRSLNFDFCSLVFLLIAICSVQISFVLGGIAWLDLGIICLVPAFIFFVFKMIQAFRQNDWNYKISFVLLSLVMVYAWSVKSQYEVANVDDSYHVAKVVAHSIRNAFSTRWEYIRDGLDLRDYLIDFIESLWGIAWRLTKWDWVIVLSQSLPLFILWQQMMDFFKERKIEYGGFLALTVLLSMQVYWCQMGSGFIDSVAGTLAALILFGLYKLLGKSSFCFNEVLGLAIVSSICLPAKITFVPLCFLGMGVALWQGWRHFRSQIFWIIFPITVSLTYLGYYHFLIWKLHGDPLYPFIGVKWETKETGIEMYYAAHPIFRFLKEHGLGIKPLYVLASWTFDYKFRTGLTADPWVGGNGILWTYLTGPILFLSLIKFFKDKLWQKITGRILIVAIILFNLIFFEFSFIARFMVGFHTFILAWCLMFLWADLQNWINSKSVHYALIAVLIALAAESFYCAVHTHLMRPKGLSVIMAQYKHWPNYINVGSYRGEVPSLDKERE